MVHKDTLSRHLSLAGSAVPSFRRISLYDAVILTSKSDSDTGEDDVDKDTSSCGTANIDTLAVRMFSD
jgi:hypothetical protein